MKDGFVEHGSVKRHAKRRPSQNRVSLNQSLRELKNNSVHVRNVEVCSCIDFNIDESMLFYESIILVYGGASIVIKRDDRWDDEEAEVSVNPCELQVWM
jgi:hypothetical protein